MFISMMVRDKEKKWLGFEDLKNLRRAMRECLESEELKEENLQFWNLVKIEFERL